jgi:hypothetical protein
MQRSTPQDRDMRRAGRLPRLGADRLQHLGALARAIVFAQPFALQH